MSWCLQSPPRDSIQRVISDVFAAPEYQWDSPPSHLERLWEWFDGVIGALVSLREHHPAAYYTVLAVLVVALLLVLAHMAYVLWKILRPRVRAIDLNGHTVHEVRGADWYIDQARQAIENGLFGQALGLRFRALVLRLDRSGAVTFHPAKTPAEYLAEVGVGEPEGGVLVGLVGTLYRHLFGGIACNKGDVLEFDRRASLLENRDVSA